MKDPFIAVRQHDDKATEVYGKSHQNPIVDTDVIETTFRVRYAETDQMGIVHHSSYVAWLEEGRSQWMRAHGDSYAQFEKEGLLLVVSELYLRYKQPARYDQEVAIRCWVDSVRSRQIQFNYEVVDAETRAIFASGYTRLICLDRKGNVTKMPARWQGFFGQSSSTTETILDSEVSTANVTSVGMSSTVG